MSAGWLATVVASTWTRWKRRPADDPFLDGDDPLALGLLELDEEDLAGPVLVERDRLRGPGIGVRDGPGPALLRGVPVAEREVVEPARRRSRRS